MPKVAFASSSATSRHSGAPFQNAQVLRRNQACHQCRRRKLKCDAKRPQCSTCVRSHAYAVAHAAPGTEQPPHLECTFDEVSDPVVVDSQEPPKNRFERLENRIAELETLLREKDEALSRSTPSSTGFTIGSYDYSALFLGYDDHYGLPDGSISLDMGHFTSGTSLDDLAAVAALMGNPTPLGYIANNSTQNGINGMHMFNPTWPKNLPSLTTLKQLVAAFFTFTPLAGRMFHAPTFIATLSLPPTHPRFPLPTILHAMCAMGSMYTSTITPTSSGEMSIIDGLGENFAEIQIQAAKNALGASLRTISHLFESLQAQIIVAMWYWYNARWAEACVSFAISLRYSIPCGLNVSPPFESISSSNVARSSIIPPAVSVIEEEIRRNTFWIAYMMDRHFTAINNFAMLLDDQDVCQMFPLRADQFEQGILVPPRDRQWSHEPGVIAEHPEDQVDSFILHVKSAMLLSRVKAFNSRYKAKSHLGDPAMIPDPAGLPGIPRRDLIVTSPACIELDELIVAFQNSFPSHLKHPVANGHIDVSLLTAISSSHLATIILHEAHANIGQTACISSCKILIASRAILNLLHDAYSTSGNLAKLGVFPMVCWFVACRVLIRFLRAAIDAKSEEHINALRIEVDFIRSVINEIGEKFPHAYHYGKMLNDYLTQTCGKEYVQMANSSEYVRCEDSSGSEGLDQPTQLDISLNSVELVV